jgi:nitrate reductase alpha subunit
MYQFAHKSKKLLSSIWDKFRTENPEGLPVYNQDQRISVEQTYVAAKTVNVSESMSTMLRRSDEYKEEIEELDEKEPEPTPHDILKEFYDEDLIYASDYVRERFLEILEESKKWGVGGKGEKNNMKINALLKTQENYGDHGEKVLIALDVNPEDTVQSLIDKYLLGEYGEPKPPNTHDHIEIRVTL